MNPLKRCRHCEQQQEVGVVVNPYVVRKRNGEYETAWLCTDGCAEAWHERYRAWLKRGQGDEATADRSADR